MQDIYSIHLIYFSGPFTLFKNIEMYFFFAAYFFLHNISKCVLFYNTDLHLELHSYDGGASYLMFAINLPPTRSQWTTYFVTTKKVSNE